MMTADWDNIRRFVTKIDTRKLSTDDKRAVEELRGLAKRKDRKEYMREYREANREKMREHSRKWARNNKEKRREYYQKNREKILEKAKRYRMRECLEECPGRKGADDNI